MPDQTNFETRLADAMRRYANRAPTDVDAMALAREIAIGPTEAPHRRPRWWPFGATTHQQGRSRTMLIASGATAVVAAITLATGYALIGQPIDETDTRPAAIGPEVVGDDWSFFEGTLRFDGNSLASDQSATDVVNGLLVETALGWQDQTLTTSDPRMTGSRTEVSNVYEYRSGGGLSLPGSVWANAATIETEVGSWDCRLEGAGVGDFASESGWCEGADGLEGLRAFLVVDIHDSGANEGVAVFGYITDGEGVPFPEGPAE